MKAWFKDFATKNLAAPFLKRCQTLRGEWAALIVLFLTLVNFVVALYGLFPHIHALMMLSTAAFFLVVFFDVWGLSLTYIGLVLWGGFHFKQCGWAFFEGFWNLGVVGSFALTWFVFALGLEDARVLSSQDRESLEELILENSELKKLQEESTDQASRKYTDLLNRHNFLKKSLDEIEEGLRKSQKRQSYLEADLKILSDQKEGWLEDYAELHREYMKLAERSDLFVAVDQKQKESIQDLKEVSVKLEEERNVIRSLEEDLANKRIIINDLSLKEELFNQQIQRLSLDNQSLREMADSLKKALSSKEEEVFLLKDRAEGLSLKLEEAAEALAKKSPQEGKVRQEEEALAGDNSLVDYRGRYQQLREQFAQKDAMLSEARKRLFLLEEKLLKEEKEQENSLGATHLAELEIIAALSEEVSQLEGEVASLEALVSHILHQ